MVRFCCTRIPSSLLLTQFIIYYSSTYSDLPHKEFLQASVVIFLKVPNILLALLTIFLSLGTTVFLLKVVHKQSSMFGRPFIVLLVSVSLIQYYVTQMCSSNNPQIHMWSNLKKKKKSCQEPTSLSLTLLSSDITNTFILRTVCRAPTYNLKVTQTKLSSNR